ncbi:hypothetical protein E3N88_04612 [Mikania micrantha]|uniref:Gnk2-homologous domain-containing protein n=1 Tax=Mikania micrantha TaxID=192012 RepID=A0A5N6PUY1_9ASTR|nr:hypothetical protein E3N88_04612 [Mikania micrantha]
MSILVGKLVLCFISFCSIYLTHTTTLAQPPDFLSYACSDSNYTANSSYQTNLKTLSKLPTTDPQGHGFYSLSVGEGNDTVNSVALCRGDINPDVCYRCLNDSVVRLQQICPTQKGARGYYETCMLRYSNENILGNAPIDYYVYLANSQNATNIDLFNRALWPLLSKLMEDAAGGSDQLKFASGNTTGPDFQRIYGLVQCTPDLSVEDCGRCLDGLANGIRQWLEAMVEVKTNVQHHLYSFCFSRINTERNSQSVKISPLPSSPVTYRLFFFVACTM